MKISAKNNFVYAVFTGDVVPDDASVLILSAIVHQTSHWCQILANQRTNDLIHHPFLAAWYETNKPSDEHYVMTGLKSGIEINFKIFICLNKNAFSIEFFIPDEVFFYMDEDASSFGIKFSNTAPVTRYGKSSLEIAEDAFGIKFNPPLTYPPTNPAHHLLSIPVPSEEKSVKVDADDISLITPITSLVNNASSEVALSDLASLVKTINGLKEKTDVVYDELISIINKIQSNGSKSVVGVKTTTEADDFLSLFNNKTFICEGSYDACLVKFKEFLLTLQLDVDVTASELIFRDGSSIGTHHSPYTIWSFGEGTCFCFGSPDFYIFSSSYDLNHVVSEYILRVPRITAYTVLNKEILTVMYDKGCLMELSYSSGTDYTTLTVNNTFTLQESRVIMDRLHLKARDTGKWGSSLDSLLIDYYNTTGKDKSSLRSLLG